MEVKRNAQYQYSTAAPKDWTQELPDLRDIENYEIRPRRKPASRIHPARSNAMDFGFLLFGLAALVIMGLVLVQYLSLTNSVATALKDIAAKEDQLSDLRLENDERLNGIETSIDLEEIKRIAMQDLGMRYAQEEQVYTYGTELENYVVQYRDVP